MSIPDMMESLVFDWLEVISRGTNKENVKALLTPEGISYTFDLPEEESKTLFDKWTKKQKHEHTSR